VKWLLALIASHTECSQSGFAVQTGWEQVCYDWARALDRRLIERVSVDTPSFAQIKATRTSLQHTAHINMLTIWRCYEEDGNILWNFLTSRANVSFSRQTWLPGIRQLLA
jgi:hypothetical protein